MIVLSRCRLATSAGLACLLGLSTPSMAASSGTPSLPAEGDPQLIDPAEEHRRFQADVAACNQEVEADQALNCLSSLSILDPALAALGRVADASLPDGSDDPTAAFAPPAAGPDAAGTAPPPPDPNQNATPPDPATAPEEGEGFIRRTVGGLSP